MDISKHITLDDIPDKYKYLVNLIGMNNLIKLCQYHQGEKLYIPKQESIYRNTRNRLIKQEATKYNTLDLAKKYNLTITQVKNILKS